MLERKRTIGWRSLLLIFSLLFYFNGYSQQQSSSQQQLEEAKKKIELVTQNNTFTDNLASASHNVLPIGLRRVFSNNMEVVIAVDKAIFHPEYTELSIFAKVVIPQSDKGSETTLFFGGQGIKLSYNGSIIGDARLALLQNIEIPFNNGNMMLRLRCDPDKNGLSQTYMAIDCKGFKEFGLSADLCFPDSLLKSVEPVVGSSSPSQVCGHFTTVVENWNDIVAQISLPTFEIVGLDGFVFNLQDVVFDFSDSRNSESVLYPIGYQDKYMISGAANLWRGVYAGNVEVTLPKAFNDVDSLPVRFRANDMLIDDNGITGKFSAENLLSFDKGSASGWSFSVDAFLLELEANRLIGAGFGGQIGLPFKGDSTRLNYNAIISADNEYMMQVSSVDSLDFSIFNAKAVILPNSYVSLHVVDDQFRPEAVLHGSMSIVHKDGDVPISIPLIEFRSLVLKTVAPYISVQYMGYKGKVSLGQFPVSLDNIAMRFVNSQAELTSGVGLTLGDSLFSGHTRISFLASMKDDGRRKYWQYDGTRIEAIALDANIADIINLKGEIAWKCKDPIYGDGFFGDLKLTIKKVCPLVVNMRGAFGKVDDYRYWFIDGGSKFPGGIPIAEPLTINGFAGAVSQKMIGKGGPAKGSVSSFSSAIYIPDKRMGLALKAAVLFDVGKTANGEACFDIAFSSSGGLNYIGFYGYATFATSLKIDNPLSDLTNKYNSILDKEQEYASDMSLLVKLKLIDPVGTAQKISPMPPEIKFGIMGSVGIQYDFKNQSFHAQTDISINSPGGFIQGIGTGGKAGWGVLHFDPSQWYMHLGTPDNRLGVKLGLGNLVSISTGTYLMVGSQIPAMPAPPKAVADILGTDLSSLTLGRDIGSLSSGRGFALGSDFRVATGDITFLIMYANFMAGFGFDVMLKDYSSLECSNTGSQIGLNGWFAQGQAYAYLQGELGVKVNLWMIKTKFPIIKGSAAALVQASLPNPTAFKGYLGVNVNVLGLIKGNMRFKFSVGDECIPVVPGGSPLQLAMINDISPDNNESSVSVFAMPQATFNTEIGKAFDVEDDAGSATYRVQLKSFTVTDDKGAVIDGKLKWNSNNNAVSFQAKEILPPNTPLNAKVAVSFDKFESGAWKTVNTSGKEAIEEKMCAFTTGGAPDVIPQENIVYSYPVIDQKYFLTKEYPQGYVQLQFGQKYLFDKGFDYKLVFKGDDNVDITTNFEYNDRENRLEFAIPQLKNQYGYKLKLAYTPTQTEGSSSSASESANSQLVDSEDGSLSMENRGAASQTNTSIQKSILDYGFATSFYSTFSDKINSIDYSNKAEANDAAVSYRFLYKIGAKEAFDLAEIKGVDKSGNKPLVQPVAELKEPFYIQTVNPLIYNDYPMGGIHVINRDEKVIGVPPVNSVFVYSPYIDMLGGSLNLSSFYFPFSYETGIIVERDFTDLQSQVVNNQDNVAPSVYKRFVEQRLPFIKKGKYKVILRYTLPDGRISSSSDFYFNNFLEFNP